MKLTQHTLAKFGGTSVATHEAMTRCAKLIANHPTVKVVVVSAPSGVTNLLVKLAHDENPAQITALLDEIKFKINSIITHLKFTPESSPLIEEVTDLLHNLERLARTHNKQSNRQLTDEILSHGERISARLFTCILRENNQPSNYQDARQLIKTTDTFNKAEVLISETEVQVKKILLPACESHIIVTEGFIGSTMDNVTTTLGRGGSDYSAALLAEAMHADVLQIWTDVPGIYTVDPRLVPHAKPIDNMSFAEAAELAQFGAKILHPATLWPAIRKNIPVFVGSSMHENTQGSWIRATYPDENNIPLLHAISLRKHQSLLTINSLEMLHTHGFLAKIFSILSHHKLSVDLVTTSEVSVALTLNHSESGSYDLLTPEILEELRAIGNVSLTIDKNLCLIALIGNKLNITSGISGRVFKRLSDYNIRLICHGASEHNLCFLVDEKDAAAVVSAMHEEFFE